MDYLLTHSMEKSPSWGANRFAASQIPCILWNPRFITTFTSARHLSLSWATSIQSISPHPTSWRSILILSSHLCLGLPSGLLASGFPTKNLYTPLPSPAHATCPPPPISFFLILSHAQYWVRSTDHLAPHYVVFPLSCYLVPLGPKYSIMDYRRFSNKTHSNKHKKFQITNQLDG